MAESASTPVRLCASDELVERGDAVVFDAAVGVASVDGAGRTRVWDVWRDWLGKRAGAGRLAPKGFPQSKRFRPK